MTGRVGIDGQRLWIRCPECGDSQNDPNKAHCNIDLRRFIYHCYRCGAGGKLSGKEILKLVDEWDLDLETIIDESDQTRSSIDDFPPLLPGAGSSRKSALDRYHLNYGEKNYDAFYLREPRDNVVCGIHLRSGKMKISLGDLGYAWPGGDPITSSQEDPIYLVEGPYDVLTNRFVGVMGLLSSTRIRPLVGHSIVLFPDSDVWTHQTLLSRTLSTIKSLMLSRRIFLLGMVIIPDGDPDDHASDYLKYFVDRKDLSSFITKKVNQFIEPTIMLP